MLQARIPSLASTLPLLLKRSTQTGHRVLARSHNLRCLSTTSPLRASEAPKPDSNEALASAFTRTAAYQKISQSPDAIAAIKSFAEVLHKSGVDTSSGKPPSMLQMSKLMLNSEFREASKNLIEEFKKAGVDVNDKAMIDEITNLMKNPKI